MWSYRAPGGAGLISHGLHERNGNQHPKSRGKRAALTNSTKAHDSCLRVGLAWVTAYVAVNYMLSAVCECVRKPDTRESECAQPLSLQVLVSTAQACRARTSLGAFSSCWPMCFPHVEVLQVLTSPWARPLTTREALPTNVAVFAMLVCCP